VGSKIIGDVGRYVAGAVLRRHVEIRLLFVKHGLAAQAVEVAAVKNPDVSDVTLFQEAANCVKAKLTELECLVGWQPGYLISNPTGHWFSHHKDSSSSRSKVDLEQLRVMLKNLPHC
jgi:hypothetical protein